MVKRWPIVYKGSILSTAYHPTCKWHIFIFCLLCFSDWSQTPGLKWPPALASPEVDTAAMWIHPQQTLTHSKVIIGMAKISGLSRWVMGPPGKHLLTQFCSVKWKMNEMRLSHNSSGSQVQPTDPGMLLATCFSIRRVAHTCSPSILGAQAGDSHVSPQ